MKKSSSKELFVESGWVRVAPNWKFWNKQEIKTISCTKCDFKRTFNRIHRGPVLANLSRQGLTMALMLHSTEHPKKKSK